VSAGLGYAEGAVLARKFGAWQVICWSLILAAPLLFPIVWHHVPTDLSSVSLNATIGFLYVIRETNSDYDSISMSPNSMAKNL
jgi:hypothetical protein